MSPDAGLGVFTIDILPESGDNSNEKKPFEDTVLERICTRELEGGAGYGAIGPGSYERSGPAVDIGCRTYYIDVESCQR